MASRARIVCTLGPACSSLDLIRQLAKEGMDVARLNMSHGKWDTHAELIGRVREVDKELGKPIALLADLQGPKIRLGVLRDGEATLADGARFVLDGEAEPGDATRSSTTYPSLAADVRVGDTLYIDDGHIELRVVEVSTSAVATEVVVGGVISDRKGVNIPSTRLDQPVLSEKDKTDLRASLRAGVDWIALSFVRAPGDAEVVREIMREVGVLRPIVAKIETPQAVEHLDAIADTFNGLMVARGDLGLETPLEKLPSVQRRAIDLARDRAIPAIVATQMLDSMIESPTPTRAEVADVATAIVDGADAVMLSGETSIGNFPVRTVRQMRRIVESAEGEPRRYPLEVRASSRPSDALARAAVHLAGELGAAALCVYTASGRTARSLARHRTGVPLLALTPQAEVVRALSLVWGVQALHVALVDGVDDIAPIAESELQRTGMARRGDTVVLVAGSPLGAVSRTNWLRVLVVGADAVG